MCLLACLLLMFRIYKWRLFVHADFGSPYFPLQSLASPLSMSFLFPSGYTYIFFAYPLTFDLFVGVMVCRVRVCFFIVGFYFLAFSSG